MTLLFLISLFFAVCYLLYLVYDTEDMYNKLFDKINEYLNIDSKIEERRRELNKISKEL
jgi:hypothetical protein